MKCPKCGGEVQYVEEVSGAFFYRIDEDGYVNFDRKDYFGDSWESLMCVDCNTTFDYEWDADEVYKIKIKGEFKC